MLTSSIFWRGCRTIRSTNRGCVPSLLRIEKTRKSKGANVLSNVEIVGATHTPPVLVRLDDCLADAETETTLRPIPFCSSQRQFDTPSTSCLRFPSSFTTPPPLQFVFPLDIFPPPSFRPPSLLKFLSLTHTFPFFFSALSEEKNQTNPHLSPFYFFATGLCWH